MITARRVGGIRTRGMARQTYDIGQGRRRLSSSPAPHSPRNILRRLLVPQQLDVFGTGGNVRYVRTCLQSSGLLRMDYVGSKEPAYVHIVR